MQSKLNKFVSDSSAEVLASRFLIVNIVNTQNFYNHNQNIQLNCLLRSSIKRYNVI